MDGEDDLEEPDEEEGNDEENDEQQGENLENNAGDKGLPKKQNEFLVPHPPTSTRSNRSTRSSRR